ncbi:MAG: 1-deoxy-D-xylulose-5-phosphate reductoisomerase [Lentisphaerae bacterium]|nr:1-deoxy-D-xylulose-5-phosphate reductoisomerase [Lentisphaerota bacterium]
MQKVVVLGASGSIGGSAADVLAANRELYQVHTIAAKNNLDELLRQTKLLAPQNVITASREKFPKLQEMIGSRAVVRCGMDAMIEAVTDPEVDIVLCAIIGTAGIMPVLSALAAGKKVALASKEVLVLAGELVMQAAAGSAGGLVPVDSEHSGVFQCLEGRRREEIRKVWLTASGGPFRTWEKERIDHASLSEALAHPTWQMGRKITIDSASMMNKALELVEARYLFDLQPEQLDVIINPQSIVHALVELTDGSMLAQMSVPDMRLAIAYGLSYPARLEKPGSHLDLAAMAELKFFAPDNKKFPSLDFAREAMRTGGTLPAVMNAANEVAVERFCAGEISFGTIWKIIESVMASTTAEPQKSLEQIFAADREARIKAHEFRG